VNDSTYQIVPVYSLLHKLAASAMLWKELSGWEVFVCRLALILLVWWLQLPTEIRAACTSTATGLNVHFGDDTYRLIVVIVVLFLLYMFCT
jgi:hypothetical protein